MDTHMEVQLDMDIPTEVVLATVIPMAVALDMDILTVEV